MATSSQRTQVPLSQISETLEQTVADLDHARAADLLEMNDVRTAKFTGLARDRVRLAAKLGSTHPRVAALDRNLALHQETTREFKAESATAEVPPPRVDAKSWALHGNVLDARRAPVKGVTVALYQKNSWVQRLGYSCTDDNGYFVLHVADAGSADAGSFSATVVRRGNVIYTDPRPVIIQPATVEYREIVLGPEGEPCPSPEGNRPPSPPSGPIPGRRG